MAWANSVEMPSTVHRSATLALATDLQDLRRRRGRIVVGYTSSGDPVTAEEVEVAGAMAVILAGVVTTTLARVLRR